MKPDQDKIKKRQKLIKSANTLIVVLLRQHMVFQVRIGGRNTPITPDHETRLVRLGQKHASLDRCMDLKRELYPHQHHQQGWYPLTHETIEILRKHGIPDLRAWVNLVDRRSMGTEIEAGGSQEHEQRDSQEHASRILRAGALAMQAPRTVEARQGGVTPRPGSGLS